MKKIGLVEFESNKNYVEIHLSDLSMTTWAQFCHFLTTTYLHHMDTFNPECGQKWDFLDYLPPQLFLST